MVVDNQKQSVGDLAQALPKNAGPWYKQAHLWKLNFCIFSLILFCRDFIKVNGPTFLTCIKLLPTDTMDLL